MKVNYTQTYQATVRHTAFLADSTEASPDTKAECIPLLFYTYLET